ncbi:hypothetical protein AA103196_2251 [Ameyamaea chiangmaiensis NBRC 103196]|uniref:Uncharacterized protein n=1 Tax=Ameyamaea chiangmaiensis TaxID=442969 RepID=A0A850P8H0_9PROT|nr:hypothetical protein [Ameyamaea chiangmaiensis]MBS4075489.1 hypothetical protein [Ameyamaea chiangmaiensis]NVN38979.1 hypothetical protein [Ameyamaea chiangmaiensis]GBQ69575.1 hypothetical protein AA103196_2251 [Ameyamaea chiangmaiensis NBRC 103196]
MADLTSITALNTLISTIAGKHESDAVKADLALAGTAVSLLVQTLAPRLDPTLDLTAVDAGLAKAFSGITDTITAIETPVATTSTETTTNA